MRKTLVAAIALVAVAIPASATAKDAAVKPIVVSITGHGLKTQEAVVDHIGKPIRIKPTLSSFEENVRL